MFFFDFFNHILDGCEKSVIYIFLGDLSIISSKKTSLLKTVYIIIILTMIRRNNRKKCLSNSVIRYILLLTGSISLGLGIIGIFLPLLPTTPFLLLAATCYAKSSPRIHNWLLQNKWFGSYIKHYQEGKGIPPKIKLGSITLLWITILFSIQLIIKNYWIKILLVIIAILVSIHILLLKTYTKTK